MGGGRLLTALGAVRLVLHQRRHRRRRAAEGRRERVGDRRGAELSITGLCRARRGVREPEAHRRCVAGWLSRRHPWRARWGPRSFSAGSPVQRCRARWKLGWKKGGEIQGQLTDAAEVQEPSRVLLLGVVQSLAPQSRAQRPTFIGRNSRTESAGVVHNSNNFSSNLADLLDQPTTSEICVLPRPAPQTLSAPHLSSTEEESFGSNQPRGHVNTRRCQSGAAIWPPPPPPRAAARRCGGAGA